MTKKNRKNHSMMKMVMKFSQTMPTMVMKIEMLNMANRTTIKKNMATKDNLKVMNTDRNNSMNSDTVV